jgi:hypothetical protein
MAERLLNAVLDAGITFIDTVAGLRAERGLHRPSASRAGVPSTCWRRSAGATSLTPPIPKVRRATSGRARSCGTTSNTASNASTRITWTCGKSTARIPHDLLGADVLETMFKIRDEGKVRHIAVSMGGASEKYGYVQMQGYLDPAWAAFEAMQVWYSALVRHSEAGDQPTPPRRASARSSVARPAAWIRGSSLADACTAARPGRLCARPVRAPRSSCCASSSRIRGRSTIIVGTKSLDHLAENVAAVQCRPAARRRAGGGDAATGCSGGDGGVGRPRIPNE